MFNKWSLRLTVLYLLTELTSPTTSLSWAARQTGRVCSGSQGGSGVRVSDNLQSASLVLVVEGSLDRTALVSLLSMASSKLSHAVGEGTLAVEALAGVGNLPFKLTQLRDALCVSHVFLDADRAAFESAKRAASEGLLEPSDQTFATCAGLPESESEDMYYVDIDRKMMKNKYNVCLSTATFRSNKGKWAERLERAFKAAGQYWDESVCAEAKAQVADCVVAAPEEALHSQRRSAFDTLVECWRRS